MSNFPDDAPPELVYRHCPMCTDELRFGADPHDGRRRQICPGCGWVHHVHNPIGALAVVEHPDGIVLTHPVGGPAEAPASLPGLFLDWGDTVESGLVRAVRELTGFDVEPLGEFVRFQQEGTLMGTALIFGVRMRVVGGSLRTDGREGPARVHPLDALPAIIPTRLAIKRVFATYVESVAARV